MQSLDVLMEHRKFLKDITNIDDGDYFTFIDSSFLTWSSRVQLSLCLGYR